MITRKQLLEITEREFNLQETMQVIQANKMMFWSWGANQFGNIDDKGLIFRVRGHHHKGYIFITLAWNDTYTVTLITTHGNIKKTFKEIYFDVLQETIDNAVEKVPEYTR